MSKGTNMKTDKKKAPAVNANKNVSDYQAGKKSSSSTDAGAGKKK